MVYIWRAYIRYTSIRDTYDSRNIYTSNGFSARPSTRGTCVQNAITESTGIEGACIKSIYLGGACTEAASIGDICMEDIYAGSVCGRGASISNTSTGEASANTGVVKRS